MTTTEKVYTVPVDPTLRAAFVMINVAEGVGLIVRLDWGNDAPRLIAATLMDYNTETATPLDLGQVRLTPGSNSLYISSHLPHATRVDPVAYALERGILRQVKQLAVRPN